MKQLYVNLAFKADTKAAEANLHKLKNTLSEISALPFTPGVKMTEGLKQASVSAQDLQRHLNAAMNVKTGNLDLNRFQKSLMSANQSLPTLTNRLLQAGTVGEKAFLSLHSAMAQAGLQINKNSTLMGRFITTLKNTARWQLSSSLLMGVTSMLTSAVSYAQELDKSLNRIQIVTGKSAASMADFAKQANAAAKSLNATTTAYTNAALIYYQQGLDGKAVLERANTTVKLANVVGKSAEEVSEWMTSIWNNFYDGTEKLEYYADAITALGAATASSADEIATGLEKFSAVADTVGLSYEYATAALATVTAQTRQSADVVGTAFKTLFARMQDLKLGETLEDGTTLGQYSEAMSKVGVNIQMASGELKDMNLILDELGARWTTLEKDQQVALAKSVAGLRQYNQFIALMDNYDIFQQNVTIAEDSEGTLQRQADIYATSWEAAKKKVKASYEGLVDTLFPMDTVKDFTTGLAKVLDAVADVVDMFGGLENIILLIGTIMLNKFQPQIASAIDAGISKISSFTLSIRKATNEAGGLSKAIQAQWNNSGLKLSAQQIGAAFSNKEQRVNNIQSVANKTEQHTQKQLNHQNVFQQEKQKSLDQGVGFTNERGQAVSPYFKQMVETYKTIDSYNTKLLNLKNKITAEERQQLATQLDSIKQAGEEVALHKEQISLLQQEAAIERATVEAEANHQNLEFDRNKKGQFKSTQVFGTQGVSTRGEDNTYFQEMAKTLTTETVVDNESGPQTVKQQLGETTTRHGQTTMKFDNLGAATEAQGVSIDRLTEVVVLQEKIANLVQRQRDGEVGVQEELNKIIDAAEKQGTLAGETASRLKSQTNEGTKLNATMAKVVKGAKNVAAATGVLPQHIKNAESRGKKLGQQWVSLNKTQGKYNQSLEAMDQNYKLIINRASSFGSHLTKGVSALSSAAMGVTTLTNAINALGEEGLTFANLSSLLMGISMTLPSLIGLFNIMASGIHNVSLGYIKLNTAQMLQQATEKAGVTDSLNKILTQRAEKQLTDEQTQAELQNILVSQAGMAQDKAAAASSLLLAGAKKAEAVGVGASTGAVIANATAWYMHPIVWILAIIMAVIAAIVLLTSVMMSNNRAAADAAKTKMAEQKREEAQAIIETAKAAEELSDTLDKLAEEYKKLKSAGESTQDVFKQYLETIPELIEKYKELGKLDPSIKTENLELAFEALKDGRMSLEEFQAVLEGVEKQVASSSLEAAQQNYELAGAGTTADYDENTDNRGKTRSSGRRKIVWAGKGNADVLNAMASGMGDFTTKSTGRKLVMDEVDLNDTEELIKYYEAMVETRDALQDEFSEDELAKTGAYQDMLSDIEDLSEAYEEAKEAQDGYALARAETFDQDLKGTEVEDLLKEVQGIEDYTGEVRQQVLEAMRDIEGYGDFTDEQLEAILKSSDAFAELERGKALFEEITPYINASGMNVSDVQAYYDALPRDEKELLYNVDWSLVTNEEDLNEQIQKIKDTAERNSILQEAISIGVMDTEFKMYSELLANANSNLEKDSVLTDRVALAQYKLNKGLSDLNENWDKNIKVLKKSTSLTPEYAKALGEVSKGLEAAFGVPVSAEFIQRNLGEIEKIVNGDVEALDELQNKLAEDYVMNLAISGDSVNDNLAVEVDKARNALLEMLKGLDMSLEIGEGTTISQDYLNTIQQMLDAGQITEEQLQQMMRAKGFEFEITEWKDVQGPKKTITRTNLTTGESETIEESELMRVPVINGQGETIKDGKKVPTQIATAKAVRSTNASSVNFSQSEKKLEQQKQNKEEIEQLKEEKDVYADINDELKVLERNLDRISKKKDKAFGKDKLYYINQEKKALEETIRAQKDYISIAQAQLTSSKEKLNQYGFEFGLQGNITNYNEVFDEALAAYEAGKQAAGTDEEELEKWDTWWENFETNVNNYRENIEGLGDAQDELDELIDEQLEKEYEAIEYTVEFKLEINDAALKGIEWRLKQLEDDAYAAAEALAEYSKQSDVAIDNFHTNEDALLEWLKLKGIDSEAFLSGDMPVMENIQFNENDIEFLQTTLDNMINSYDQITESISGASDAMKGWVEELNNDFDKLTSKLDHLNNVISSFSNIVELIGPSSLGMTDQLFVDMLDDQLQLVNKQADVIKQQYETNKDIRIQTETAYNQAIADGNDLLAKELKDQLELYTEKEQESFQNWLDVTASSMEIANSKRDKQIEIAIKDFLKETTGFSSMDELQQVYDQQKEIQELYVADYEKAYQLSKLSRQLDKSMNDMTNVRAKQKLLDLEEKINKAKQSGVKMSSYELANLEREYQLELAKIALEEAQNTKSKVRLVQNAEGGMSYLYTADQTALDDAQQKYEDAVYNSQKANDEWLKSCEEGLLSATATYIEQMAVINQTTYESEEERNEAIKRLNDWYIAQQKFFTGQIDIVLSNNAELHEEHMTTMENQNFDFITDFKDTFVGGLKEGISDAEGFYRNLTEAIGNKDDKSSFMGRINTAQEEWRFQTETVSNQIKGYLVGDDKYGQDGGVKGAIEEVDEALGVFRTALDYSKFVDSLSKMATAAESALSPLKTYIDSILSGIESTQNEAKAFAEEETKKEYVRKVTAWLGFTPSETWNGAHTEAAKAVGLTDLTSADSVYKWATGDGTSYADFTNNTVEHFTKNPQKWDRVWQANAGVLGNSPNSTYVETGNKLDKGRTAQKMSEDTLIAEPKAHDDVRYGEEEGDVVDINDSNADIVYKPTGSYNTFEEATYVAPTEPEKSEFEDETVPLPDGWEGVPLQRTKTDSYYNGRGYVIPKNEWSIEYPDKVKVIRYFHGQEEAIDYWKPDDILSGLKSDTRTKIHADSADINLNGADYAYRPVITYGTGKTSIWGNEITRTDRFKGDATVTITPVLENEFLLSGDASYTQSNMPHWADAGVLEWFESYNGMRVLFGNHNKGIGEAGETLVSKLSSTGTFDGDYRKKIMWYPAEAYDTGGYTGEWGPEGRMAMLHQKEIVLNAHDTENILSVVDMVRQMATQLDFNALAMANGLGNLVANTMIPMPQAIDQNVTITAEFPNATNREEIKEAFGDLVNLAAQYASRR